MLIALLLRNVAYGLGYDLDGALHRQPQHGTTRKRCKVMADDRVGYDGNVVQNILKPRTHRTCCVITAP